jgi:HAD superfamily hydrolase (TIGR01549 family)
VNQSLWDRYDKKEIDFETIKAIRFKTIFEKANIKADPILFEQAFREGVRDSTIEVIGARDLLEYLYSKYYIFAASNSNLYQQLRRLSRSNLLDYFNDLFISEDIGYRKPSKEFFLECIRRSHFDVDEIIVIGDSLTTDIEGAYNSNLKSIWYNPKRKEVNHNATYMVYDLNDIKKIL